MKQFVVAELSVIPIGTSSTGLSDFVAVALREIKKTGVKYQLCPTSTVFEADLETALAIAKAAHRAVIEAGAKRVITTLRVDERLDRPRTMKERVEQVIAKAE